jgi:hypothetical protein
MYLDKYVAGDGKFEGDDPYGLCDRSLSRIDRPQKYLWRTYETVSRRLVPGHQLSSPLCKFVSETFPMGCLTACHSNQGGAVPVTGSDRSTSLYVVAQTSYRRIWGHAS